MNRIGYITLLVALLTIILVMCSGCPNGGGNYETQGIYYKGKLMSNVNDNRFINVMGSDSGGFMGMFKRDNNELQAAWQQHGGSAPKMPRKFTLEVYPSMGSWMSEEIVYTIDSPRTIANCTTLKDKEVGDKIIGQVEVILNKNGGYVILDPHRPGTYILIKH